METNNHKIVDYDAVLDAKYGREGTSEREQFRREALDFYTGSLILQARKEACVTQQELAHRIGATKSYISRIENGAIHPSAETFYRIINALGLRVEVVKPVC
jgi:DNA-binding XRE family transcriptional regulator